MERLDQFLETAPDPQGDRIRKHEADLDINTNAELEAQIALLQKTLDTRKARDAENTEGIQVELAHVRQQVELNKAIPLSLAHLEIYRSYLGRVSSDNEEIQAEVAALTEAVEALLAEHPQRLIPRSGDANESTGSSSILNVPIGRRRQMLAAFILCFFTGLMMVFVSFTLLFYFVPVFMLGCSSIYYGYVYFDTHIRPRPWAGEGARMWPAYRRGPVFKYFVEYFPIRVAVEEPKNLPDDNNYLMCLHPHGVQCASVFGLLTDPATTKLLPGLSITAQTLPMNFWMPVMREHCIATGVGNASRDSIVQCITHKKGASTVLVVGGAKEALYAAPHTNKIALKDRMGFVKLAIKTGAQLVPIYAYGENSLYENLSKDRPNLMAWQRKMQKLLTFAPLLVAGRGVFSYSGGVLPHRRPITLVIGSPIKTTKNENPTQEEIEAVHTKYIAELTALFNRYRNIYDPRCEDLMLV